MLFAVGGHHRGESRIVEDGHQPVVVGGAVHFSPGTFLIAQLRRPQATHGPGLQHGRWGDDALEPGRSRRGFVGVDRIVVAHRFDPVGDHGEIDLAGAPGAGARRKPDEGLELIVERLFRCCGPLGAHRADRFIPSPAVARISR